MNESSNVRFVERLFELLNSLNADELVKNFADDASLLPFDEKYPSISGKKAIYDFYSNFFKRAKNISFELIGPPNDFGNLVVVKKVDSFEIDGARHTQNWVDVIYIVNGKVKKWLASNQESESA